MVVAGTDAAAVVLPHLARQLIALHAQRADVAAQAGDPGAGPPSLPGPDHPCPGSGVPAAAVFLAETLGKTFDTGAHLASYAGLAPVTRRSGSSIRGEHVSHGGNKRLKRAMFASAFASLRSDWTAGGFSDSACFVLQAAFFRSRKSLSTSFGVRYPRAE